jgi:hypothetical protein
MPPPALRPAAFITAINLLPSGAFLEFGGATGYWL